MRRWRVRVQLLLFVAVAALIVGPLFSVASASAAPQGGSGAVGRSQAAKPKPSPTPSPSPTPDPSPSPTPDPSPSPTPDPSPTAAPTPPSPHPTKPPVPTSPTSSSDPVAGSQSGATMRDGGQPGFVNRSIPDAAVASGRDSARAVDLKDGSASASPSSDAVTGNVGDRATVREYAATGARVAPCDRFECRGGIRGFDLMMLITSACVVAGVITAAATSRLRRLRLADYYRTAGNSTPRGLFATLFKSRD